MSQLINDISQITADTVNQFQKAVAKGMPSGDLGKAINQSSNFTWYDLQSPAKNLFPVLTPLRNITPRVSGGGGTATNWKAVTSINSALLRGYVPEGTRNGTVTVTAADKSSSYKAIGLEQSITVEAELAAVNFEDIRATSAQRLLWATMIEEEQVILGGNNSVALGTPATPTVAAVGSGGTLPDDAGGYTVRVCALTYDGWQASSVASGVVQQVSVTNAVANIFTYNGGSSQISLGATTGAAAGGGGNSVTAFTTVVPGAVAYAWYLSAHDGTPTLNKITTINSAVLTALNPAGQAYTAITADRSQNSLAFNGLLYTAWTSGSNAYIANQATGTPGTGTGLTGDGMGGISEFNTMFKSMWDNYRLSPTAIYVNSQEMGNITNKVLANGVTANTIARVQYVQSGDAATGIQIKTVLNRYAMGGSVNVPIEIHPFVPAGTVLAVCNRLPYPMTNVSNVWEMKLRRDYYQIEWPMIERKYPTGVNKYAPSLVN